jgi:hypothetical protein
LDSLCALMVDHVVASAPLPGPLPDLLPPLQPHSPVDVTSDAASDAVGAGLPCALPAAPCWTATHVLMVNASRLAVHRFRRRLERPDNGFVFQTIPLPWAPSDVAWMVTRQGTATAEGVALGVD